MNMNTMNGTNCLNGINGMNEMMGNMFGGLMGFLLAQMISNNQMRGMQFNPCSLPPAQPTVAPPTIPTTIIPAPSSSVVNHSTTINTSQQRHDPMKHSKLPDAK